jgi:Cytochrome c7 and related cytochrome c
MKCTACHVATTGASPIAPPVLTGENYNMGGTAACGSCHNGQREFTIFIAKMNNPLNTGQTVYNRCSDCHSVPAGRGSDH